MILSGFGRFVIDRYHSCLYHSYLVFSVFVFVIMLFVKMLILFDRDRVLKNLVSESHVPVFVSKLLHVADCLTVDVLVEDALFLLVLH